MSTIAQTAAFGLADELVADTPGGMPFRAVAFVLSVAAHRRAGAPNPERLHRRIGLLAKGLNKSLRDAKHLDYDPLDVVEFDSFADLLKKRPKSGTVWQDICIITHAGGEQPNGFTPEIFFGREIFTVSSGGINDLLDAINANAKAVGRFRKGFATSSQITMVGCGVGSNGPDVAVYVRELFGTDGKIKFTKKNVDFFSNGFPGTPKDPEKPQGELRPLTDADWNITEAKDDLLNQVDPPMSVDFFRD